MIEGFARCLTPETLTIASYAALVSFAGLGLLVVWLMREPHFEGRRYFIACVGGMMWWLASVFFESASSELQCKLYMSQIAWVGIVIVPASWLIFSEIYCVGLDQKYHKFTIFISALVVTLIPTAAITNEFHHLFYTSKTRLVETDGILTAVFDHGVLFSISSIIVYIYLTAALFIVGAAAFRAPREQRAHFLMLLFGTIAPIAANISYLFDGTTIFGVDPTPFTFAFILLVFSWAIFANRMFDLSSQASDIIYFNLSDPILVVDARAVVVGMNPAAQQLFDDVRPGGRVGKGALADPIRQVLEGAHGETEPHVELKAAGKVFDARLVPIRRAVAQTGRPLGVVAVLSDITRIKSDAAQMAVALERANQQMADLTRSRADAQRDALTDPLTGIGNRRAMELAFAALTDIDHAVDVIALIDIDFFKDINDRYGHASGDKALQQFAGQLVRTLPPGSLAFRIGGEEFLVLWPRRDTKAMAELLQYVARLGFRLEGMGGLGSPYLTFSAGIAQRPTDGNSFERLLAVADARLYAAKANGRNQIVCDDIAQPAAMSLAQPSEAFVDAPAISHDLETRMMRAQASLGALLRVLTYAKGKGVDEAVETALGFLGEACEADRAFVYLERDKSGFHNTHEWVAPGVEPHNAPSTPLSRHMLASWLDSFAKDDPVAVRDVAAMSPDHPLKSIFKARNATVAVLHPLRDDHGLVGFVGLETGRTRAAFGAAETALLRITADAMATALQRRRIDHDLQRLAQVATVMTNLVVVMDTNQRIVWVNHAFEIQGKTSIQALRGQFYPDALGEPDDGSLRQALDRCAKTADLVSGEVCVAALGAEPYWSEFTVHPLLDDDDRVDGYVSIETVITQRKKLEGKLGRRAALLGAVIKTSVSGFLAISRGGQLVFANAEGRRLLELSARHQTLLPSRRLAPLLETLSGEPLTDAELPWHIVARTGEDQHGTQYVVRQSDGDKRVVSINAVAVPIRNLGADILVSVTDVTELALGAERLAQLAREDTLTGLANRRGLMAFAEAALASGSTAPVALLYVDLDNFKSVNDTLRHEYGDAVLKQAAGRLRACLPEGAFGARTGGDEFMMLVPFCHMQHAKVLANALRATMAKPFTVDNHLVHLTASVGVALHPHHGADLPQLLSAADIALFEAKRAGRNRVVMASRALFEKEERRSLIAQALGNTSLSDALQLYFQPQFEGDWELGPVGAEALLRWRHPVLGDIGPGEFIPIAEQIGVIQTIDEYVLSEAARHLARWISNGSKLILSVNLSAQSLTRPDLVELVLGKLERMNIATGQLVIEITETMLVALSPTAVSNVARLKQAGVSIAIDDFGTGYASLTYLQKLEVSEIKIDQSFVRGLNGDEDSESRELISAIIGIGNAMQLVVTAEGVEREAQRSWLLNAGCRRIQGALTGSALPITEFEARFCPVPLQNHHPVA